MSAGVTVVLSAGAARGMVFAGVLKCLRRRGIAVEHIIGTSMGALVGSMYCSGLSDDEIASSLRQFRPGRFIAPPWFGDSLLDSGKFRRFVQKTLPVDSFEELVTPLTVVSTDFDTGEAVALSSGPLAEAVTSTCLAAAGFAPILINGRRLIDGAYANPIPVDYAGTDLVFVANGVLDPRREPGYQPGLLNRFAFKIPFLAYSIKRSFDIFIHNRAALTLDNAENIRMIPIDFTGLDVSDFSKVDKAIRMGEAAMDVLLDDMNLSGFAAP